MRAITDDYVLIGDGGTARALSDFVRDPDGDPPLVDGSDLLPNVEGELDPCVFYPSTNADAGVAFGLRSYALIALVDGDQRLPVRLRWNTAATDPDAPVAHLDVTVAGYLPAPPDGVTDLRDLDHQVVARLLYKVPVRGTADSATLNLDLGAMGFRHVGTYRAAEASFAIPSQDAFNRLWLAMTDPAAEARLELRCLATGYRVTWAWYDELVADLVPPGGVVTGGSSAHNPAYPNVKGGYRVRYVYPVSLEDAQVVPFHLPLADHPHVYEQVPPEFRPAPGGGVLLKDEHDPGEGRAPVVYYTHTGLPGQYYYEPHEFRIPRRDDGTCAPEVVLAFKDVTTAGGALDYRVRMDYRLAPHTDRFALASLRGHLSRTNPKPTLTVLVPEQVSMVLRLPQHKDGTTTLVDVPRPVGSTTLEDGIADSLEFTPAELKHLVALLSSTGVTGRVTARLPGSVAGVPARLSFAHTTGRLLDTTFVGAVAPGTVRVEARNRIESPVVIDEQHRTPAESTPAATATPVAARPVTVAPNAAIPLDFAITPADAAVTGLDPLLSLEITPDTRGLLTTAMKNEGWATDTYAVTISTDPGYFGSVPPGGTAPLTGLRVDLVPGASVVLTADAPSTTAHLRMPLLDWLLRDTAATRFTYRVVNLHGAGDGIASAALTGTGPGALDVVPVGA